MKTDILYLTLLCGYLAAYMLGFFGIARDFVAAQGHWLWAGYSGILFFLYSFVRPQSSRSSVGSSFLHLVRLLLLFSLSVGFAVVFGLFLRPQDIGEWQLGAFFLFVPALIVAVIALTLGYGARSRPPRQPRPPRRLEEWAL
jgi:hypothetical protein